MHLYIATKGAKHEIDQFITQLQGKYLPMKWRPNKDEPLKDVHVQLGVRQIQLWEIGFPKEHYDLVATTILGKDYKGIMGNDGKKPVQHKWTEKFIFFFRKLLRLDPLPPYEGKNVMPIRRQDMIVVGLGTKQDYMTEDGFEGI